MKTKQRARSPEVWADAQILPQTGLSTRFARSVRDVAYSLACEITLETIDGRVADAKDLLALLLLPAPHGARIRVRCRGPEVDAALLTMLETLTYAKDDPE